MKEHKALFTRGAAAALLLCTLGFSGLLAGCNKAGQQGSGSGSSGTASSGSQSSQKAPGASEMASMDIGERIALGRELSLLSNTPMAADPPDALDISRDGNTLFAHGLNKASGNYYLVQVPILEETLGAGQVLLEDPRLLRTFVASHPRGKEAMGAEYFQRSQQTPIVDLISRFSKEFPEEAEGRLMVPYNNAPGFPLDKLGNSAMDLSPFYNWVGDKIIVPLKEHGVCVVPASGIGMHFAPYPDFPGGYSGLTMGALPDERSDQFVWLSIWRTEGPKDLCRLFVLDLQNYQWLQVAELDWIVYDVGTISVWNEPWLISGSRSPAASNAEGETYAPQEGQTGVRVPKLGRLIPATGMTETIPYQGNPVWDVAVDPSGAYIAYMDRRRYAMVRVEPATGKVDIDPRWWSDDTELKVFINEGGERALFWRGDILIRGQWTQHEDGTGYEEAPAAGAEEKDDIQPSAVDLPEDETEEGQETSAGGA
ncbi:hypothetical protein IT575_03865 [bacterium]|nr:hypothetical protein [bacterium]